MLEIREYFKIWKASSIEADWRLWSAANKAVRRTVTIAMDQATWKAVNKDKSKHVVCGFYRIVKQRILSSMILIFNEKGDLLSTYFYKGIK